MSRSGILSPLQFVSGEEGNRCELMPLPSGGVRLSIPYLSGPETREFFPECPPKHSDICAKNTHTKDFFRLDERVLKGVYSTDLRLDTSTKSLKPSLHKPAANSGINIFYSNVYINMQSTTLIIKATLYNK
jgi:hypothetical protein